MGISSLKKNATNQHFMEWPGFVFFAFVVRGLKGVNLLLGGMQTYVQSKH